MTQPKFGVHTFSAVPGPTPQDAFDLVTGELLQGVRQAHPERSFLVDENVQAVADRINASGWTANQREWEALKYVGGWIIVAFNLGDHRSRFGMEIVHAQRPAEENVPLRYSLTAIFDTELWGEKLATVKVGDRLTVAGQIDQLNPYEIRLRNCELV
jgi:hypothetical protein